MWLKGAAEVGGRNEQVSLGRYLPSALALGMRQSRAEETINKTEETE